MNELQPQNRAKGDGQRFKPYDLDERTYQFARNCRSFVRRLSRTIGNLEDAKQLVRASGSVAANYIEANESISQKDFILRAKIVRKEAKESGLWLHLCDAPDGLQRERDALVAEAIELCKIFNAIVEKAGLRA